jgi:hypothetical protein
MNLTPVQRAARRDCNKAQRLACALCVGIAHELQQVYDVDGADQIMELIATQLHPALAAAERAEERYQKIGRATKRKKPA